MNIKKICITAMLIALTFVATSFVSIAIPMGYANLGGSLILFTGYFFGGSVGMIVGGIGSALSDLSLGYTVWIIPTLLIKGFAGFVAGWSIKHNNTGKTVIRAILSMIVVVAGYVAAGIIITLISGSGVKSSVVAGLLTAPALAIEATVNFIAFYALIMLSKAAGLDKVIRKNINL